MERIGLLAALLVAAGCGSGTGTGTGTGASGGGGGTVVVNLDGGGAPATPPDGKSLCPSGLCNYQTGTGCSGATPSCVPLVSGSTVTPGCNPAGTVAAGAACSQPNDCVAGHLCAGGACRKLCCGGDWTGCESPTEHCIETVSYDIGGSTVATGAMLCFPIDTCDALQPASCTPSGTTCQIADATGATACLPEGTGTAGSPCPCKGGFACVDLPGKAKICVRLCKAVPGGGAPYCQSGEGICTHYAHDPAGVGECLPP